MHSLWSKLGRFLFPLQELNLCRDKWGSQHFQSVDCPDLPSETLLWASALSECRYFFPPAFLSKIPFVGFVIFQTFFFFFDFCDSGPGPGHFPKRHCANTDMLPGSDTGYHLPCSFRPPTGCYWNSQVELKAWILMKLLDQITMLQGIRRPKIFRSYGLCKHQSLTFSYKKEE